MEDYDRTKFLNLEASKRFTLISTNHSIIKENRFQYLKDFFKKTIAEKVEGTLPTPKANCHNGYTRVLCQPSSSCGEESEGKRGFGRI